MNYILLLVSYTDGPKHYSPRIDSCLFMFIRCRHWHSYFTWKVLYCTYKDCLKELWMERRFMFAFARVPLSKFSFYFNLQYTHWEDPKDPCKVTEKFADLVGDYYFICPTNKFAEMYAEHNAPVYYYFFTQVR